MSAAAAVSLSTFHLAHTLVTEILQLAKKYIFADLTPQKTQI